MAVKTKIAAVDFFIVKVVCSVVLSDIVRSVNRKFASLGSFFWRGEGTQREQGLYQADGFPHR
jgi:hypothetical protein